MIPPSDPKGNGTEQEESVPSAQKEAEADSVEVPGQNWLIEKAIGGAYVMPDGRTFWIDGPVAKEITRRVMEALQ